MPQTRVIVVNYNNASDTEACCRSVWASDARGFGLVLVDNGSDDDSAQTLRTFLSEHAPADVPSQLVTLEANRGFTGGHNAGLRAAMADEAAQFFWMLNNDTTAQRTALGALVDAAQTDASLGALGAQLCFFDRPNTVQAAGGGYFRRWCAATTHAREGCPASDATLTRPLDYINGASLFVRRDAVEQAGLLDETLFLYGDDLEWSLRLRRAGWALGYCPAARVWHKVGGTTDRSPLVRDYYAARNMLRVQARYWPVGLATGLAYTAYRRLLPKLVRRQWARLAATLRGVADFALGRAAFGPPRGRALAGKRAVDACARRVSP